MTRDTGRTFIHTRSQPPRRLEGFAKVDLRPGQHLHVVVNLDANAFAHWDTASQSWMTPAGTYTVYAGTSSRDLPLSTPVSLR
jgi:beta-glucosidase